MVYSTGWGTPKLPVEPVMYTLGLYFDNASSCTVHHQPVLHIYDLLTVSPCIKYVQYRLMVYSTGWGTPKLPVEPVMYTLGLYFDNASSCTVHHQPVLHIYDLLTVSPCIKYVQYRLMVYSTGWGTPKLPVEPVMYTLGLYFDNASSCTVHHQPVLHIYDLLTVLPCIKYVQYRLRVYI